MSNTEKMVSASKLTPEGMVKSIKALLDLDARGSLAPHGIGGLARDLFTKCAEVLSRPSVQRHGEPVMRLECEKLWGGDGEYAVDFVKPGWLQECREKGGTFLLYTQADPGEVESIKADRDAFAQNAVDLRAKVERLQAELRCVPLREELLEQVKGERDRMIERSCELHQELSDLLMAVSDLGGKYDEPGWLALWKARDKARAAISEEDAPIPDHSVEANKKVERDEPGYFKIEPLGAEFAQVLEDNFHDLVIKSRSTVNAKERLLFEYSFPLPDWAEWSDLTQTYVVKEDMICSATALSMYRKAWQAWMASAEVVR